MGFPGFNRLFFLLDAQLLNSSTTNNKNITILFNAMRFYQQVKIRIVK
jgi:hypothetical protein